MFQNKVTKYELTPKVLDCVVFCSKNLRNFAIKNDKIKISGFMCQTFSIYLSDYNKPLLFLSNKKWAR